MPIVSVIMPSYNHAKYIGQAIESVLSQTLADVELIVIDDGSTDGTQEVIQRYSDPRLRIKLRDRNVGAAQGTNDGLKMARGSFVAMVSSDDFFEPHKLETQLRVFREREAVTAVFCRPRIVDEGGQELAAGTHHLQQAFPAGRWQRPELLRRLFLEGNFLCHPSILVRRETYERVGSYDVRMSSLGDFDMWMRMAVACDGDFVVLDEPLTVFRTHAGNTSGLTPENLRCGENEWPLIVDRMGALREKPEVFRAAFPEMAGRLRGAPADVDYALGLMAIKHPVRSVRAYGLRRLYELMDDGARAERLETEHGFTTRDLIRLSQATETIGIPIPGSTPGPAPVEAGSSAGPLSTASANPPRFFRRVAREARRMVRQVRTLTLTHRAERSAACQVSWKPGYTRISRNPMDLREAVAVTRRYLEKRSMRGGICGLHLGCGDRPFAGWLNVDLGGQPELFWDLARPYEWSPVGAFDACYSEHVLEHFSRPVGLGILRQAFRTLRSGGVVRIAVPDLANVVRMYADETFLDHPYADRDVLDPIAAEARALLGSSYGTKGERLNVNMYGWGHAYLYDEEDLVRVVEEAGFSKVLRCHHSESSHAELRGLETRPEFQSGLIVEGIKM